MKRRRNREKIRERMKEEEKRNERYLREKGHKVRIFHHKAPGVKIMIWQHTAL